MSKKVITSIAACFIPALIGWTGGMEIVRSPEMAMSVAAGLTAGAAIVTFPWDDE